MYYKQAGKIDGAEINFNQDLYTYRFHFNGEQLQRIPNPHNVGTATYMSNLNKLFEVYETEATSKKFAKVAKIADKNDRYLELELLIIAFLNISLGCTNEALSIPILTTSLNVTLFVVSNPNTITCSLSSFWNSSTYFLIFSGPSTLYPSFFYLTLYHLFTFIFY